MMEVIGTVEACARLIDVVVKGDMGYVIIMSDGAKCVMKTNIKPEMLEKVLQDSLDSVQQLEPEVEDRGATN